MAKSASIRVGRVTAYRRGKVWYLYYHENGVRKRPRVGPDRDAARRLAAQTNAQLELGAPAPLSFESVIMDTLRQRWLDYHEHVLKSSMATVCRYKAATRHLLNFVRHEQKVRHASDFRPTDVEAFAAYLRRIKVAPNGHANALKKPLRDTGVKFILEVCRSMFNYAAKRRHLPPYAENPFAAFEIDRLPVEDAKPFVALDADQERAFLGACDEWQFPVFLTLMLTGMRPGELTHLLIDDLDLHNGWLYVRNKADLSWNIKTRNERRIPLVTELAETLRYVIESRCNGLVFMRRRFAKDDRPLLGRRARHALAAELAGRIEAAMQADGDTPCRRQIQGVAYGLWRDMGAIKTDRLRTEFMRLTRSIGLPELTAPKMLRHMYATSLQDTNVDPLIRNEVMGHKPSNLSSTRGLGMTAVYTHTRPQTLRRQVENSLKDRPAVEVARRWLAQRSGPQVA